MVTRKSGDTKVLCAIRVAHRQQGSAQLRTVEAYLVGNDGFRSAAAKAQIRRAFRALKSAGQAVSVGKGIGLTESGFDRMRGLSCPRGH